MSREAILALLASDAGLDAGSLGERVIDHALQDACRDAGVADESALWAALQSRPALLRQLREHFLVPETWFFRAPAQFVDLARFATGAAARRRPFRVLSLPCASGEEAVSAAIALQQAGLLAADIEVLGVDLSEAALATAKRGEYAAASLRRHDPGTDWLPADGDTRRVSAGLRRCLRFEPGNALDPLLLHGEPGFDAIFCRNLMIYLHADARRALLANLRRLARTPALLLAGHAENFAALDPALQPVPGGDPLSFLLPTDAPRAAPAAGERPPEHKRAPSAMPAGAERPRRPAAPPASTNVAMIGGGATSAPAGADGSGMAQRLADGGQLDAARALCLAALEKAPDDLEHRFLLGMLEIAAQRLDAADAELGRVLYLDPQHRGALEHRVALARRRGDSALAQRLAARLQRLRDDAGAAP
jgi:chemotaxis protein methyltransferase WspC